MKSGFFASLTYTRKIVFVFLTIILTGTILLCLPISSREGMVTPFLDSLFTATSATCVTGLIVCDTYTHWSGFGQGVILALIQLGGLGFMTFAVTFSFALGRTISLNDRILASKSLNLDSYGSINEIIRMVVKGTFIIEFIGAVILSIRFIPDFGVKDGIIKGVFHSVSAFCNAGFDLMGQIEPFSSMTHYADDPVVTLTLCALIILGGIGFYVWSDVIRIIKTRRTRKVMSLHSKISIFVTVVLIVSGLLFTVLFEMNSVTMEGNGFLRAFFHSVTLRTAGFNTIDLSALSEASVLLAIVLMFIGASSGSTGGGIKTTTFAAIVLAARAVIKGSTDVNVYGRRLGGDVVSRAVAVTVLSLAAVFFGIILICAMQPELLLKDVVFEVVSAFATVGVSTGITPLLSLGPKIIIILLMFAGRVGILTVAFALAKKYYAENTKLRYPVGRIMVG